MQANDRHFAPCLQMTFLHLTAKTTTTGTLIVEATTNTIKTSTTITTIITTISTTIDITTTETSTSSTIAVTEMMLH